MTRRHTIFQGSMVNAAVAKGAGLFTDASFPDAMCDERLGVDPELWFNSSRSGQERERERSEAVEICNTCPEQVSCLRYALDNDIREGIWGGVLPADRMAMRSRRRVSIGGAR